MFAQSISAVCFDLKLVPGLPGTSEKFEFATQGAAFQGTEHHPAQQGISHLDVCFNSRISELHLKTAKEWNWRWRFQGVFLTLKNCKAAGTSARSLWNSGTLLHSVGCV